MTLITIDDDIIYNAQSISPNLCSRTIYLNVYILCCYLHQTQWQIQLLMWYFIFIYILTPSSRFTLDWSHRCFNKIMLCVIIFFDVSDEWRYCFDRIKKNDFVRSDALFLVIKNYFSTIGIRDSNDNSSVVFINVI